MAPKLSALVICLNEESHLRECLESVQWCDEIVVVDSGSTDRSVEIAKEFTPKVLHRAWTGFIDQVNFILGHATGEWVFCIDADERCTTELRDEIRKALENPGDAAGFDLKRHTWYMGRWINHGGWYPDWKVRVLKRDGAACVGKEPHYRLQAKGPVVKLNADLVHFTYDNFKDQLKTVDRYSDVFASEWREKGRKFRLLKAVVHPWAKFISCYFLRLGFLDGWAGFVIAVTSAYYIFIKYVKFRELVRPELVTRPKSPSPTGP